MRFLTGTLLTCVTLFLSVTPVYADLDTFEIYSGSSIQENPTTDGHFVAWTDDRGGTAVDVMLKTLTEPNLYVITPDYSKQIKPVIDESIVVWQDYRNVPTGRDIYAYNMLTKTEIPVCTHAGNQDAPDIGAGLIVWQDYRDGSYDVYGYDLNAAEPQDFLIAGGTGHQMWAAVDQGVVVWQDNQTGNFDLYYAAAPDWASALPVRTDAFEQSFPDISGTIIVWQDKRSGDYDIYGYDIIEQREFEICLADGDQGNPIIYGDIVVWEDKRDSLTNDSDIYAYDLVAQTEFAVTATTARETQPYIFNRLIVWNRDGDLWGAFLPEDKTITVGQPNGGEELPDRSTFEITWTNEGDIEQVVLDYSTDMGENWTLIRSGVVNTGAFEWTLPAGLDSDRCLVRVTEAGNPMNNDVSDAAFTVFPCSAALTADANHDCIVDFADLALLSGQWLLCGHPTDLSWCGQ